ncbi:uncharacterized protein FIESC28_05756 [Fusarium coffeatum]|uniref:Uncharacterized protein n=1 Tax=Fusarium coffeatum TaxID=231269 RepID=A0A366RRX9_9HYPO|nr:uncharacterized protein FIESC28_05756 [Fusarium coffeatum]RBR19085.1 hypothetical protein FIESC28_05756 [Fusarium coffeatum]
MDAEKGETALYASKTNKSKKLCSILKKAIITLMICLSLCAAMFGIGVFAAEWVQARNGVVVHSEAPTASLGHSMARRDEAVDASYPISTKTALSTIYEVRHTPTIKFETVFETVHGTTYVDEVSVSSSSTPFEESTEYCEEHIVTTTETVTIVIAPDQSPAATSAALPETPVIVTGGPETVTETKIDTSVISSLPDAVVTGNPETVTETDVDTSVTSGLPDAVVTGNPETVTKSETDTFITSGLPDATITGNPQTVTRSDFETPITNSIFTTITVDEPWPLTSPTSITTTALTSPTPRLELSTITTCATYTLTMVYPQSSNVANAPPESTFISTVYETEGEPSTSTTTIFVPPSPYPPYPTANTTLLPEPTANGPMVPHVPTPPVVTVSGGNKKPEPRGWGGTSGTTNISCTVMLVAVIMFLL